MTCILVVEDECTISNILVDYLRQAGFTAVPVGDGRKAVEMARSLQPGLILLDLMLPGLDGLEVCRELRRTSAVPIIMVTARVEEIDRLLGLEIGADDYICKPFSPREVVARVKTVLRRAQSAATPPPAEPLLAIDEAAQRISVAGRRLELTRTEFRVLALLAGRPGRVYSRMQILDLAYDDDQDVSDRVVDSHIKNIRRKLAEALPGTEMIHSVYGIGYRFEV